jgi:hypothetical protein
MKIVRKIHKYQSVYGNIRKTVQEEDKREIDIRLEKVLAVPVLSSGSETCL